MGIERKRRTIQILEMQCNATPKTVHSKYSETKDVTPSPFPDTKLSQIIVAANPLSTLKEDTTSPLPELPKQTYPNLMYPPLYINKSIDSLDIKQDYFLKHNALPASPPSETGPPPPPPLIAVNTNSPSQHIGRQTLGSPNLSTLPLS